ncbi:MAG: polymer-forming cytoskeletal protein [Spirochaetaceae bacterium]|nr:polymer-forming cytoskeletal protein [Spirochaetaceae bacterium]
MARNKRDRNLTILGKETIFSGHLKFSDDLKIEGRFAGSIDGQGTLTVAKKALCQADYIRAFSVLVQGEVAGNITAIDKVELAKESKMHGNITASKLKIADEVEFEGSVKMIKDSVPTHIDLFSQTSDELKAQLRR